MDDAAVARAMRFAFERLKLVLEPSGAVALAAVLEGAIPVAGRDVLIFATGGNVALDRFVVARRDGVGDDGGYRDRGRRLGGLCDGLPAGRGGAER